MNPDELHIRGKNSSIASVGVPEGYESYYLNVMAGLTRI
ncbi:5-deoxy-glucuronate isomerase [Domibacillus sp. DTU_2020_1001157_1_SI_ALB_TIR_016]